MLQWIRGAKDGVAPGAAPGIGSAKSSRIDEWLSSNNNERYFGFENFGNTCYCNSVLQALYFCKPFRECVLQYKYPLSTAVIAASADGVSLPPFDAPLLSAGTGSAALPFLQQLESIAVEKNDETLLTTLQELFTKISTQKKRTGVMRPQTFVTKLKQENELFQGITQQDAQEFLNYLLNAIAEILVRHKKEFSEKLRLLMPTAFPTPTPPAPDVKEKKRGEKERHVPATWVHELFEGQLTNETKCLTCETITNKDEAFLDLSIDISQHSSVSTCLRNFSTSETLCAKDKFYCDTCKSLQEAEKRMKIKSLPNILVVHLKRFKYQENLQRFMKLNYRVVFPFDLKLFNTTDDAQDPDCLYTLSSVIVHLGIGPHQGHYISLVKSHDNWIVFDDDTVERVDESEISRYYGDLNNPGTGYILLYERVGLDSGRIVSSMTPAGGIPVAETVPLDEETSGRRSMSPTRGLTAEQRSVSTPSVPSAQMYGQTGPQLSGQSQHPQGGNALPVGGNQQNQGGGGGGTSGAVGVGFGGFRFKRPSVGTAEHLAEASVAGTPASQTVEQSDGDRSSDHSSPATTTTTPENVSHATSWWKRKT
ncbi:hypothetical protein BJ741DRAFT_605213 [Chytriomyces cf. hyalinus JEL632]|nr:hypothetical protein BJ741DRAFT_605213 [Chytriomyces cf. hyalinus JEL632]